MISMRKTARRLVREAAINLSQRRGWYADEPPAPPVQPTTPPQTPAPDPKPAGVDDSGADDKPKVFDESYVKELRTENADWRKKTRDLEKRLQAFEDAQNQKTEAELKEQQKWKELADKKEAELKAIQTELATERLKLLRVSIGGEFKLPAALIARLQGETEDDIRADAQALVEALGLDKQPETNNQQARGQTNTTVAAPGGQPVGRTDAQRKAEYFGGANTSPLFTGGKVVINSKTD